MYSKLNLMFLIAILFALSACATLSGDECMTSDWSAIGYEDGSRGYTMERMGRHRKACAKHGVTPDFVAYQSGRDQGLRDYCQPNRGFRLGANGDTYNGVCSVELEAGFLDGYNTGFQLYSLHSDVDRASSSIESKQHELEQLDATIQTRDAALISDESTQEERVHALAELKDIAERIGQLEAEIQSLYEIRARSQVELEHFQAVVADMGY